MLQLKCIRKDVWVVPFLACIGYYYFYQTSLYVKVVAADVSFLPDNTVGSLVRKVIPTEARDIALRVNSSRIRVLGQFKIEKHAFEKWKCLALNSASISVPAFVNAEGNPVSVSDENWTVFNYRNTVSPFATMRVAYRQDDGICLVCAF